MGGKYEITKNSEGKEVVSSVTGCDATYYIVENKACPIGFAVDYVLTKEEFANVPQEQKAFTLMQAAIVDKNELSVLSKIAVHASDGSLNYECGMEPLIENTVVNKVNEFHRDSHGFSCTASYDKVRLVYFTVPWSEGWSAVIDGAEAEILYSGGMMALVVPAGEHQIEFSYHTPGFRLGATVSAASFCIFIAYCVHCKVKLKRSKGK